MNISKLIRSCAWVIATTCLGVSSVGRAQPAPQVKLQPAPAVRPLASSASASAGVVNINDASADELERLPGVGPAKAKAIVEHRRSHPFHRVDDLTKVKGIGKKTFARLRPYLTLVGATTLTEEAPRSR
jgi:competence protein ComEA